MKEKWQGMREKSVTDEELAEVIGSVEAVEIARCGRGYAPSALYSYQGEKYCPACYHKMLMRKS